MFFEAGNIAFLNTPPPTPAATLSEIKQASGLCIFSDVNCSLPGAAVNEGFSCCLLRIGPSTFKTLSLPRDQKHILCFYLQDLKCISLCNVRPTINNEKIDIDYGFKITLKKNS